MKIDKLPSIVLEAPCNLWIWHASFGWAGSLNDINIWDRSPLLKSWLDGTFSLFTDFPFSIAGRTFEKLFVLVDGIYPELARFVKTFSEPVGKMQNDSASGKNHHGRISKEHSEYFRESSISLFAPLSNGMLKIFQTLLFLVLFCTT